MNALPVISNASPLIALTQIGQIDLLKHLFGKIVIPRAVAVEIAPTVTLPAWIEQRIPTQPVGSRILDASLGPGESESISLALETGAQWVILDERAARQLAQTLGLPVIGTLGILLAGKRHGLFPLIEPYLTRLRDFDFYISQPLFERILQDADEMP